MARQGAWNWQLVLLLGMSAATAAGAADTDDDPPPEPKQSKVWVNNWFSRNQPPKPAPKADSPKSKTPVPKPSAPKADPGQAKRLRELSDCLRRLAVCDQLGKVAMDTNDQELMKQSEQLKERVWLTYKLRTVGPMTHPESDDQMLGRSSSAGNRAYEPLLSSGRDKDRANLTASKEDYRQ